MIVVTRRIKVVAWSIAALLVMLAVGLAGAGAAHAREPLPLCADNIDNDGDGKIDFRAEPGCESAEDTSENDPPRPRECSDGLDNDADARIDWPSEPGCDSAEDDNETNPGIPALLPACSNTLDDDGDGRHDFSPFGTFASDPGCNWAAETSEQDNRCSDGLDNDGDGRTDFPADFGCANVNDDNETDLPQCDDGRDNDGDGLVDVEQDSDCTTAADESEEAAAPPPPPPPPPASVPPPPPPPPPASVPPPPPPPPAAAAARCADGVDNDSDGRIDYPADAGCASAADHDESNPEVVLVVPSSAQPPLSRTRLLTPFPIVRIRGVVKRSGGVQLKLLTVRAPKRSTVTVYCRGRSCPRRRVTIKAGTRIVRVRAFEKRLRGGTILTVYVTKRGFTGKYTRFRIKKRGAPSRIDRCATAPGATPHICRAA